MNKYPNGYLPKVVYHWKKGNNERAKSFLDSHVERYGLLTKEDLDYINQELKKENS
jgi:hypothetical protein